MANCFVRQMRAQQQVASLLKGSCHTGWCSELEMCKKVSVTRTDHEAGSQASTRQGTSSSDSEDLSLSATTLTIRNIPFSYTTDWLQEELDLAGFWGKYDFLYLPSLGSRLGFKSALVNFASPAVADKFRAMFHHGRLEYAGPQDAPLSVAVPPIQGFAACASRHPAGVVYKDSVMCFVDSKPTVTKPPPGLESVPFQPPIHRVREQVPQLPCGRRIPLDGPPGSWHVRSAAAPAATTWSKGPSWANQQWTKEWSRRAITSPSNVPAPHLAGSERAATKPDDVEAFYISL